MLSFNKLKTFDTHNTAEEVLKNHLVKLQKTKFAGNSRYIQIFLVHHFQRSESPVENENLNYA